MICLVSGGFDPLHDGHIDLIHQAARYGRVIVALNSDAWLTKKKGYTALTYQQREKVLCALREVSIVFKVNDSDGTVCDALKRLRPDYFMNGGDRAHPHPAENEVCEKLSIVQLFDGGPKVESSRWMIERAKHKPA